MISNWELHEQLLTRFQASAVKQMRTVFFWAITQDAVVIHYRCFGTTYQSHRHGQQDGTDRLTQYVGKVLPLHAA